MGHLPSSWADSIIIGKITKNFENTLRGFRILLTTEKHSNAVQCNVEASTVITFFPSVIQMKLKSTLVLSRTFGCIHSPLSPLHYRGV